MNRIALFSSPFEISIIPSLDRSRLDLIATQDFEETYLCWIEKENQLIALKKPNILITWNLDNGKIVDYVTLDGPDFN
jgi:hypothetical protein